MSRLDLLKSIRDTLIAVAAKHGASNLRVFGSVARGEDDEASDVDLLVELERGRSLFDLVRLHDELADVLGGPVDVVTERGLSPYMRDRVLSESVPL